MEQDAGSYTSGLKDYLTRVLGKDIVLEDVPYPYVHFGIESVVHVSNAESGIDFHAGFDVQSSGRANSRLRFFLQLSSPGNGDLMGTLLENPRKRKRVSKNLGNTTERFNPDEDIYSVYCCVRDPDHLKPEDLYKDLLDYFLKGNISLARK